MNELVAFYNMQQQLLLSVPSPIDLLPPPFLSSLFNFQLKSSQDNWFFR